MKIIIETSLWETSSSNPENDNFSVYLYDGSTLHQLEFQNLSTNMWLLKLISITTYILATKTGSTKQFSLHVSETWVDR